MPLPVIVSCRMFWISASLSCPVRVVVRTLRPMRRADEITTGTKSSSTHDSFPPKLTATQVMASRVKNCWRKSAMMVDMAYCTRSISLMIVDNNMPVECFWKKETDLRSTASYKSLRMSVIMPKPA